MNRKIALSIGIVVIVLIIGFAIYQSNQKNISKQQTIKIGGIYGLTGPLPDLGEQMQNGTLLAIEKINKEGGIKEREFELISEDSKFDPKVAISALKKLIDIDHIKIVSTVGSAVSLALKPETEKQKILLFAPAAHPKITENSNYVLRHSNIANYDAEVLADEIMKRDPQKIGIIYINDDWGKVFSEEFQKNISIKIPTAQILNEFHDPKETDFRTQISKLIAFDPDIIVVSSFGKSSGLIIKGIREQQFKKDIFTNNGIVLSPEGQQAAGQDNLKGIYYQDYNTVPEQFKEEYEQRFQKKASAIALIAYTDMELLKYAIEKVGDDPENIARFIKGLKKFDGTYESISITPQGDMVISTKVKQWK